MSVLNAREALGAVLTIVGIGLLAFAFTAGAINKHIGEGGKISFDAWMTIIGWFLIIIGPALWFGETPAAIKEKAKAGGGGK